MKNNFDLKKFLKENQLTKNNKVSEGFMGVGKDISGVPLKKDDPTKLQATLTRGGFPNKKEQQVIDIAREAFALMDEQPGTSAEEALKSVLDI